MESQAVFHAQTQAKFFLFNCHQEPAHSRASLAFYKGQLAKAIFLWTREVLNPKTALETKEARLLSILYTLFHTRSVPGRQFNGIQIIWLLFLGPFLTLFDAGSKPLQAVYKVSPRCLYFLQELVSKTFLSN